MPSGISVVWVLDKLPVIQSRLQPVFSHHLRAQAFQTESDEKTNIVAAGRVREGLMLATTQARQTGPLTWEIGPSAESADGFPYPIVQEFGSVRGVSGAYFATHAGEKAAREFPARFRNLEGQLL